MVFKKPTGGRDDKPKRSSARSKDGDDKPKRSYSASAGKPYASRDSGLKKNYSTDRRSTSNNSKPFSENKDTISDRPRRNADSSSFGDKRSFAPKGKPYTGRGTNDDKPKRNFGESAFGEKKPFPAKSKPYSGRNSDIDKPKRSFSGERSGERKFGNKDAKFGVTTGKKDFKSTTSAPRKHDDSYRPAMDTPVKTMRSRKKPVEKDNGLIRLNRYIANAGICSRRKADELIIAGVISVNGEVVAELGYKIDPVKDVVRYNGEALKREKMVYVLLNKPKDYITTTDDPQERRTVMHLVEKASRERIYPVGRLDRNTTGLLLMTNDGDLADKLSHPRNNVVKLYMVELNKNLTQGDLNKIGFGLELEDGFVKPDTVSYVAGGSKKEIGIQIHSGKNRIVRRIFEHLGYEVVKLDRSVYANLTKKDLPRGRWRYLDEKEVIQLKHLI
ncbi:pseudouridine synthase [Mucilaginibacter segetis]|uniref:Pseudouridine synthase n=1 Tax=Mucilaginibacter segetis TaxID=2793071 RepID=A0A934PQY4_9SPHI|nr:pseudouridine synthase [Mucilaginibacter segetis]MBK0377817.1 rRNA pseudouridine synthase [Mucilaginibacter segetis]